MSKIISASICITDMDTKTKAVKAKNGKYYYPISIILNDEKDKFGNDCAITEGQSKEEFQAKTKKKYIGNGKVVWNNSKEVHPEPDEPKDEKEDLPF